MSLSDCFCVSRYWTIYVLQLFVKRAVASQNLKLTISSYQAFLVLDQKGQDKNLKFLENEKSF